MNKNVRGECGDGKFVNAASAIGDVNTRRNCHVDWPKPNPQKKIFGADDNLRVQERVLVGVFRVSCWSCVVSSIEENLKKGDDGKLAYVGGEKTEIERVNVDTLNKFFMNDLVKDIGYNDVSELYWLEPGKELNGGLRLLRLDMDVVSMYEAAIANGRRVEVFTEHPVDLPEFAEENNEPEPELEILTVNRTPVKHRTKLCVRRPPTPKKKRKKVVKLSETVGGVPGRDAQTEDAAGEKEVHHTPRNTQQPEFNNDQPNIPTHSPKVTFDEAPRIIQLPNPPTEPNLPPYQPPENTHPHPEQPNVSAASEENGNQIPVSAESVAPTVDKGPAKSVECLPHKVMVDIGKRTCSCRFRQLTGLPCRHACAALAYQNRKPEEHAHNWLSMGAYNSTYEYVIQPVPSQEYWQYVDLPPILPPVYKKHIRRPKLKRDKKNDAPKEPQPDPHRAPRKYGPITCNRSCSKKKEAMAGSAGGQSSNPHPAAEDDGDEAARLEEMFWEETLEAVEAAASQPPHETTSAPQPIPNPVRSPSTRPTTTKKPPRKKKNLRRPPPTTHQPQSAPVIPATTTPSPTASDVPPTVTPQTMQAASQGTTSRFMEFMPTPTVGGSSSTRWPQPAFRPPPKKRSTTAHLKEGSSGSSNSTPIP
ncbi:hypothetical protein Ahy_B08g090060 [Arachis hypogaea]|uniref:SWIM-type domain-containing protein n=1 Tax=Arachis hypogaea TaxID=3818 RepID=A0A444XZJ5_ARAHY|nr:hypothetical protein Ahy_B08g090060 [Arachis hypogaea]